MSDPNKQKEEKKSQPQVQENQNLIEEANDNQDISGNNINQDITGNLDKSQSDKSSKNAMEEIDFSEWENEIHVHPRGEKGAYKTIQEAIDVATAKTKIVVAPGIYKEHLIINGKSDLEITSLNTEMPAIILAVNSPCVFISNTPANNSIKLGYLRIIHRGMRDESENNNNNIYDDDEDLAEKSVDKENNSFNKLKGGQWIFNNTNQLEHFDTNYSMDLSVIEGIMNDNRGVVSAISIFNSTVMIINTQITLGFLTHETNKTIPGIYCERSILFMESVMVKGNPEFLTCGLLAYDTSIKISNSRMVRHKSGGFLATIQPTNQVVITKCQFLENMGCGLFISSRQRGKDYHEFIPDKTQEAKDLIIKPASISVLTYDEYLNGPHKKALQSNHGEINIESNLCDSNIGVGMRLENCLNLALLKNKFYENTYNGGEVIDCEGLAMLNEFVKNGENGLEVRAYIRKTEIKVMKNTFCENEHNGLLLSGRYNNCVVLQNEKITNNLKAGICINGLAFPIITENKISTNCHQGILICDDSAGYIEKNKIYKNLKAGVAFGGDTSFLTKIVNNELFRSRSEGIFLINGNGGIVARNKVFENNDGIVVFNTKEVEIAENDVFKNVRSGFLIGDKSEPKLLQNQIKDNKFIGIMFKDSTKGEYKNNIIEANPTQCYYTNSCKDLIDVMDKDNTITGRIETETGCNIF